MKLETYVAERMRFAFVAASTLAAAQPSSTTPTAAAASTKHEEHLAMTTWWCDQAEHHLERPCLRHRLRHAESAEQKPPLLKALAEKDRIKVPGQSHRDAHARMHDAWCALPPQQGGSAFCDGWAAAEARRHGKHAARKQKGHVPEQTRMHEAYCGARAASSSLPLRAAPLTCMSVTPVTRLHMRAPRPAPVFLHTRSWTIPSTSRYHLPRTASRLAGAADHPERADTYTCLAHRLRHGGAEAVAKRARLQERVHAFSPEEQAAAREGLLQFWCDPVRVAEREQQQTGDAASAHGACAKHAKRKHAALLGGSPQPPHRPKEESEAGRMLRWFCAGEEERGKKTPEEEQLVASGAPCARWRLGRPRGADLEYDGAGCGPAC